MNSDILHLDYEYDKIQLAKESNFCKYRGIDDIFLENAENTQFFDFAKERNKHWFTNQQKWKLSKKIDEKTFQSMPESFRIYNYFKKILNTNLAANFFIVEKNTELKPHIDVRQSAINFIITGNSTPIIFEENRAYYYNCALINIKKTHSVPFQADTDRLLFKLSMTDMSFKEAKERLEVALF